MHLVTVDPTKEFCLYLFTGREVEPERLTSGLCFQNVGFFLQCKNSQFFPIGSLSCFCNSRVLGITTQYLPKYDILVFPLTLRTNNWCTCYKILLHRLQFYGRRLLVCFADGPSDSYLRSLGN